MSVDREGLESVLAAVEITDGVTRRTRLRAGELLAVPPAEASLVYVVSGQIRTRDPRSYRLRARDALLSLGSGTLAAEAVGDAEVVVIEAALDGAERLAALLEPRIVMRNFDGREPAAGSLLAAMGGSCTGTASPLICRIMTQTVVLSLIRSWADAGCAPDGWPTLAGDPFLDRVVAQIHADPGADWTLARLASAAAMSRSVLADRFQRALGRSPARYIAEVRVEQAKRLLATGGTVSDVSRRLGYASDEGFSRAFRRRTGLTPSGWRAQARRDESANSVAPTISSVAPAA